MREYENLEKNVENLTQLRKDEVDRMQKQVEGLQHQQKDNVKVNEKLVSEKAERIAQLKMRREL